VSLVVAFRAGFRSAWGGVRPRSLVAVSGGTVLFGLLIGLLEHHAARVGAADRALATSFRLLVPLSALALSTLVIGSKNLRELAWPVARFGHSRHGVALGQLGLVTTLVATTTLLSVAVAVLTAHLGGGARAASAPLATDLFTSSWIALLVGAGYSAWFGLGATFGKNGGGRMAVLALDFVLGATGFFGAVMPRGIAYALIGHSASTDLGQRATSAIGLLTVVILWGVSAVRCRD
jgi:hypothetical protein